MSQAYNPLFARVYNELWAGFARQVAPLIQAYYEGTPLGKVNRTLLDLACGTGQLARFFLEQGYRVTGLDLSAAMLEHASQNAGSYLEAGQANFIQGDMADFQLPARFGLVVATYDAVNHLADEATLRGTARAAMKALTPGGSFLFDLNTRKGLRRWNGIQLEDREEVFLITRGIYDPPGPKAWTRITGFVRSEGGQYDRFDETVFNTVFDLARVMEILQAEGFHPVHCAQIQDLAIALKTPEDEGRVFVVASKPGDSR